MNPRGKGRAQYSKKSGTYSNTTKTREKDEKSEKAK
jgi:hypothetical protein